MSFVNTPEALERLRAVRCYVLDMDGTFYLGDKLIEGSLLFMDEMKKRGIRVLFLTNNSSHDAPFYTQKLARMGCTVSMSDIYTSGMATAQYILSEYPHARVALMGNEFLQREFTSAGVTLDMEHPDIVCVGFDTSLTYEKLRLICDHIRAGLPYIATHPDFNCPTQDGYMPDIGAMMALIEASTGRRADVIIGKPNRYIMDALIERTGFSREEICMCGDRLYTDIATGVQSGVLSLCVLSGEASERDIESSAVKPDIVLNRLAETLNFI